MRRQLYLYFFLIFVLGLRAMAEAALPDPMLCGASFKNLIELSHKGNTSASSYVSYFMRLSFEKPGQFTYVSNLGRDVRKESIDGVQLQFIRKPEDTEKISSAKDKALDCRHSDMIGACVLTASDVINRLDTAYSQLLPSGDKQVQQAALLCAKSILLSQMAVVYKFKELGVVESGEIKLEALDASQSGSVIKRLELLKPKKNTKKAKT